MDCSEFTPILRNAIIAAVKQYCDENPTETPYGLAIIPGQLCNYLMFAIATEERLLETAGSYEASGYKYNGTIEGKTNLEILTAWLRWANPDDGWKFGEFPAESGIADNLNAVVEEEEFADDLDEFVAYCNEVLATLWDDPDWKSLQNKGEIVVGVTWGEDPNDYVWSAEECNPKHLVDKLQEEFNQCEKLSDDIARADD